CGADQHGYERSLRESVPVDLDVLEQHPLGELHRAVVAQQLLDRGGGFDLSVSELGQLIRVAQQGQQPVADEAADRLEAGGEEKSAQGDDLVPVEAVAALLGGDKRGEETV